MESLVSTSNEADNKTKQNHRVWAYGAVSDRCGWYPEHFINASGIAIADFAAAEYGSDYLYFKKGASVTPMSEAGWAYGALRCETGWFPNAFVNSSNVALANFDGSSYGAEYLKLQEGDVIIRLAIPKYPFHKYTSKQQEFLGCIEDAWIRRRWEKVLETRRGMESSMTSQRITLYVYPWDEWDEPSAINCKKIDCRSIRDSAAFRAGGGSPILQKYVIKQLACVLVMQSVLSKLEDQVSDITFICKHGKHRSMACAKLCQLMLLPSAWIYQRRERAWFDPLSQE